MSERKDNRRFEKERKEKDHQHGRGHTQGRGGGGGGHGGGGRGGGGGHQHGKGHDTGGKERSLAAYEGMKLPQPTMAKQHGVIIAPLERKKEKENVFSFVVGSSPPTEEAIREGSLFVGEMALQKWTSSVAYGRNPSILPRDICLTERGTALPGDVVAIAVAPQEEWDLRDDPGQALFSDGGVKTPQATQEHKPFINKKLRSTAQDRKEGKFDEEGDLPTLPDGRKIRHLLVDERDAVPMTSAAQRRPCARVAAQIGAQPPTDWPVERQPKGKVIRVLERRFNGLHPCRFFDDRKQPPPPASPAGGTESQPQSPAPQSPAPPQSPGGTRRIEANRFYKFRPYDEKFPMMAVYGRDIPTQFHDKLGQALFLVQVTVDEKGDPDWAGGGKYPVGAVVRSLGLEGTAEAESKAITSMCQIRDEPFSEEVEACVLPDFQIPSADELATMGRRDLRGEEFICTIDPATARDLDDALSCEQLPGGRFRVGVHIADVSYFVPFGSALDMEAMERSTSTYLVERVIPMLPRKLSEDYCSLNAGVDKFAFSVIWTINNDGEIENGSEWIGQSVIRNSCRMAYEDAQRIIEGDESGSTLVIEEHGGMSKEQILHKAIKSIKNLYKVSSKLRQRRWERGALALNRQKMKLQMTDMDSRLAPCGYTLERSIDANWVVEELMLLANCRIGEKIVEFQPENALLRRHDVPQSKKITPLVRIAKQFGYEIQSGSSKQLSDTLERYKDVEDADALRLMLTYCMSLAQYVSAGMDEREPVSHYALAVPIYTHFTSPIRRYCDLVVHRQLLLSLEIEKKVKELEAQGQEHPVINPRSPSLQHSHLYIPDSEVAMITDHANDCKIQARLAGTHSTKSFFCYYLRALGQKAKLDPSIPTEFTSAAICTKVTKRTFVLYSRETAVEAEVHHNSRSQRWVEENAVDDKNGKFNINWGPKPGSAKDDDVVEEAGLFFNCVVSFKVIQGAKLELEFIVHPPWERASRSGVPMSLSA